jgi:transcriptional regulator with XRE-family HTH domain
MENKSSRGMSEIDRRISRSISRLRQVRGLSQTEIAKALGISFQQFQKYEHGQNRISAARLVAIAQILGVTPHDLLYWTDERTDHLRMMPCGSVNQKAVDLWHSIENKNYRRALVFLMQTISREQHLHPQIVNHSVSPPSEVEK